MKCPGYRVGLMFSVPLCFAAILPLTNGQQAQSPRVERAGRRLVAGTVFQINGQPVDKADVTLQSIDGSSIRTVTGLHGEFTFRDVPEGVYTVSADKQLQRSERVTISPGTRDSSYVRLVLTAAPTAGQGLLFSDEPGFIISGVTDWTAVGGHGSDTTLRTSEDLARATSSLKVQDVPTVAAAETEEAQLRMALGAKPHSASTNLALGKYYVRNKDYQRALEPLQIASAISHEGPEAEYYLALTCHGLHETGQATLHIQRALTQADVAAYHGLAGELAELQGNPYAAVHHMERAAQLEPSEGNYFAWASELLLHRAVLQATEIFQRAANAYPSSVRMQTGWGSALFAEAHYDEAAQRLCRASDLQPEEVTPYLLLGRVDEAAPAPLPCVQDRLARFLKLSPDNADAHYLYALSMLRRTSNQDHKQAESLLQAAVRLNPSHAAALLQLGIFAAARQQYPEAIEFYRKATVADPMQAEVHYRLAVAYDRTGHPEQAAAERILHNSIKLHNAEEVEQERRKVKQFLVTLQQPIKSLPDK